MPLQCQLTRVHMRSNDVVYNNFNVCNVGYRLNGLFTIKHK